MAHHDWSICECVIALAEDGVLSASTAGELNGVPKFAARAKLQKYRRDEEVGRCRGTGLWCISSLVEDAALVAKAWRNHFVHARDLKAAFLGKNTKLHLRLKEAGLRAQHAVKELLTDEHKLYHLAFAESNVEHKWDRVIFSDESTFSSANDGPVLVYRPRGEHYECQHMSTCKRSGCVVTCLLTVGVGSPMKGLECSSA